MKIGIDIQAAISQRAGVGRYTKCLVEHLAAQAGDDHLRLFYFDFQRKGMPFPVPGAAATPVRWIPGRIVQGAWKTIGFPPYNWFSGPADVYHFPNFILPPLTRGRSVVTVHDVSFLRFPEATEEKNLAYLRARIRDTVNRADAIITDSFFSGREIQELLGVAADRIFPIHLGLTRRTFTADPQSTPATLKRLGLDRPFLLTLGTLEPRKNIPFLIDVFEKLEGFEGDLVVAGMKGWKFEPILQRMRRSPVAKRIRYLEYVDDESLAALYAGAELFVFPSIYEGFGFPPLEAMSCGTAVISSSAGSLAEVLGDAAEIVEGLQTEEWCDRIHHLLSDPVRKAELIARGRGHVGQYQWEKTAAATWQVYRRLAKNPVVW
jgi:glycosyltransferase involved in cell wall biosynthesis